MEYLTFWLKSKTLLGGTDEDCLVRIEDKKWCFEQFNWIKIYWQNEKNVKENIIKWTKIESKIDINSISCQLITAESLFFIGIHVLILFGEESLQLLQEI